MQKRPFTVFFKNTTPLIQNHSSCPNNVDQEHSINDAQVSDKYNSDTSFISQTNPFYYETDDLEVDTDNDGNSNKFAISTSVPSHTIVSRK
ncbi:unnamed protein product, partial [Rotaria magnacalcarata]